LKEETGVGNSSFTGRNGEMVVIDGDSREMIGAMGESKAVLNRRTAEQGTAEYRSEEYDWKNKNPGHH